MTIPTTTPHDAMTAEEFERLASTFKNGVTSCPCERCVGLHGALRAAAAQARTLAAANEKVRVLTEALEQITGVYAAMRQNLTKLYPQDGWSSETVTLDKANAALAATSTPTPTEPKDEQT